MKKRMSHQQQTQARRVRRSRGKIHELCVEFLSVHRTPKHIYAQVFSKGGETVIACASSVEADLRKQAESEKGKISVAKAVGVLVAKRANAKGIKRIAFDRSGYRFHGRVKALAEAARAHGLEF